MTPAPLRPASSRERRQSTWQKHTEEISFEDYLKRDRPAYYRETVDFEAFRQEELQLHSTDRNGLPIR